MNDLTLEGRALDFIFVRTYRSQVSYGGALGEGWTHSLDQRIWSDGNGGILHLDGMRFAVDEYPNQANGALFDCATAGVYRKCRDVGGGSYEIRDAYGKILHFHPINDTPTSGLLDRVVDSFGNFMEMGYSDDGKLASVHCDGYDSEDFPNRRVDFLYQGGKISALIDVENARQWTYGYDSNSRLEVVSTPAVEAWDGAANPVASRTMRYGYSGHSAARETVGNLESVTYPGAAVAGVKLYYNDLDHVTLATVRAEASGPAPSYSFSYSAMSGTGPEIMETKVTDRRSNVTALRFDANGLAHSVLNAKASVNSFEYNVDGEVTRHVRPAGDELLSSYSVLADRFQQGNVIHKVHVPAPGKPGSQNAYEVLDRYEPIYNQPVETVVEGGSSVFDYQEDPATIASLIASWGIVTPTITPLGDVNGDGLTSLAGGGLVERSSPPITTGLPTGINGPVTQVQTWTHDGFGRVLSHADAEGSLTVYSYGDRFLSAILVDVNPATAGRSNSGTARWTHGAAIGHVEARTDFTRDGRGNIVEVLDPRGVRSKYEFNALDEIVRTVVAESFESARLDGDLAALVGAGYGHLVAPGVEQLIDYNAAGLIARVRDDDRGSGDPSSAWSEARYEYDLAGRRLLIKQRLSGTDWAVAQNAYDAEGNLVMLTDARGDIDAYVYDVMNRQIEIRHGASSTGGILASTAVTTYVLDENGNQVAVQGAEDHDGDGQRDRTIYEFDGRNRHHRSISAVGTESRNGYNVKSHANRAEVWGQVGGPSPAQNSTSGNVLLVAHETERNEVGRIVLSRRLRFVPGQTTGSQGPESRMRYDREGRVVENVDAGGRVASTVYDGMGRIQSRIDHLGNRISYLRDAAGFVKETTRTEVDPFGGSSTVHGSRDTYDGLGRLIRSIESGEVVYYAYGAQGLMVRADGSSGAPQADPLGLYTQASIGAPGNTIRYTSVKTSTGVVQQVLRDMWGGGIASGGYDPWASDLNPALAPAGASSTDVSTIVYDLVGNVTDVTTAAGEHMSFGYDALNHLASKVFPDGSSMLLTYWRDGQPKSETMLDPQGAPFRKLDRSYDAGRREVQVDVTTTPSGYDGTDSLSYEWNGMDRITFARDQKTSASFLDAVVTRTYDSLGRELTETLNGQTVSRTFDDVSPIGITFPNGRSVDRHVDDLGRLSSINESVGGAPIVSYEYYGSHSKVAEVSYGNGTSKSYRVPAPGSSLSNGYSLGGDPMRIEHRGPGGALASVLAAAFDGQGRASLSLRQIGATLTGSTSSYDSRGRLSYFLRMLSPGQTIAKGVLRSGDGDWGMLGTQVNQNAPAAHVFLMEAEGWAYASIAGRALQHDVAGNRTGDAWFNYDYDALDRLVLITDGVSGAEVARYSYDAFTRRVEKQIFDRPTERFHYDGDQIVEVRDVQNQVVAQYVHGQGFDEHVQWMDGQGAVRYFMTDCHGSVVGMADDSGTILERVSYDAFGAPRFEDATGVEIVDATGASLPGSSTGNRFLFQGRDYDDELVRWRRTLPQPRYFTEQPATGQYHYRYRYMSPEEGRFTGRDPYAMGSNGAVDPGILIGRILHGESESPYEFLAGDPVNRKDPYGLSTLFTKLRAETPQETVTGPDQAWNNTVGAFKAFQTMVGVASQLSMSEVTCRIPLGFGSGGPAYASSGTAPRGPSGGSTGGSTGGTGTGTGSGSGSGSGSSGSGAPKGPTTGPKGPKVPGPIRTAFGDAARATGKIAGPVTSVMAALEKRNMVEAGGEILLVCPNLLNSLAAAVFDHAQAQIDGGEGLPVACPPAPKATSAKLFDEWGKALEDYLRSKDKNGNGDKGLWQNEVRLRLKAADTSCVLFGKLSERKSHGHKGPISFISEDYCKPKWNVNQALQPGRGLEVQNPTQTSGKQGSLDLKRDDQIRVAALERFEETQLESRQDRKRRSSHEPGGAPVMWSLALTMFGLVTSRLFFK